MRKVVNFTLIELFGRHCHHRDLGGDAVAGFGQGA